ncbi:hypothetical protein BO78DRAFT_401629 [Aspergillus sclerotiicarbonarius CBS 121057]|uniref:Uncharacterized protein n=1 Tax=Aspergillus sclerotiicarbonarius (strain CBS 121057 / IBT 28362) TaxID=1448318 RepID=A0A319DTI7_ASPSB|nr:hypothetical protein BO78DRAFT_401629 [Aspergillus sclerotiicarbonarius CBS 121057]
MSDIRLSPAPPRRVASPPPPAPVPQSHKYSTNRAASAPARFTQPFYLGSRPTSPHRAGSRADSSAGPRSTRPESLYSTTPSSSS